MTTRFLFECSYVYNHPDDNTGIQRVVRNIIACLPHLQQQASCVPIIIKDGDIFRVQHLKPIKWKKRVADVEIWATKVKARYWHWYEGIHNKEPFASSLTLRRILYRFFLISQLVYEIPLRVLVPGASTWANKKRIKPLDARTGDVLILLDSSWHNDFSSTVRILKKQGVTIVGVVYDLIPLTHPQFCDEGLVKVFEAWFDWILQVADGFMCISKTIAEEVKRFDLDRPIGCSGKTRWYDHFYLGAELDLAEKRTPCSQSVREVFSAGRSVYLFVGTIEPRKNHAYLLDAFDRLWAQATEVSLCLVGKIGWKCASLVGRIESHPELNRRLFMLTGLSDSELEYCYRKATALIYPSFVEGFGLPLIEALARGLPAMASDIPVFREIVGDDATYFDLSDPRSLCQAVKRFEQEGTTEKKIALSSWKWPSWRESAEQLLERVKHNVKRHQIGA